MFGTPYSTPYSPLRNCRRNPHPNYDYCMICASCPRPLTKILGPLRPTLISIPAGFSPAVIKTFALTSADRRLDCEELCQADPAVDFRQGPTCWATCSNIHLRWNTFWSSVFTTCSQARPLAVKASQWLSVTKGVVSLTWPFCALVSMSSGLTNGKSLFLNKACNLITITIIIITSCYW